MSIHVRRNKLLLGFAAVAVVIVLQSAAYACTYFLGQVTATSSTSAVGAHAQGGVRNGSPDMGYCQTPTNGNWVNGQAGTVTFSGGQSTCNNVTSTICYYKTVNKACPASGTQSTWQVNWVKGYWNGVTSLRGQD